MPSGQNEASPALAGASPTGRPGARTSPVETEPSSIEATALRPGVPVASRGRALGGVLEQTLCASACGALEILFVDAALQASE